MSEGKRSINAEQEIKTFSEISTLVQESPAEKSSFEEILKHLGQIIDFRSASLYTFSKDSGKLDEVCTIGRRVDLIDFVNFEMGSGISAWVAKHGRSIVLNNLRKSKGGTHTKSFLAVPMVFGKEILGVVNLAHDETDAFTKRDAEIVSIGAAIMALLVERISHQTILSDRLKQIGALEQELEAAKCHKIEQSKMPHETDASLGQRIGNSLAIISGNAQFLVMTLKNANPSVIKRLRAIDREAGSIAANSQGLMDNPSGLKLNFLCEQEQEISRTIGR